MMISVCPLSVKHLVLSSMSDIWTESFLSNPKNIFQQNFVIDLLESFGLRILYILNKYISVRKKYEK